MTEHPINMITGRPAEPWAIEAMERGQAKRAHAVKMLEWDDESIADLIRDGMSDAQDMDTSIGDLARAAVKALRKECLLVAPSALSQRNAHDDCLTRQTKENNDAAYSHIPCRL